LSYRRNRQILKRQRKFGKKSEEARDSGRNAIKITTLMSEISERKQREINIVIYGVPECK
jgi:hypothetical protein